MRGCVWWFCKAGEAEDVKGVKAERVLSPCISQSFLGVEQCFEELNTRGLVRIWCLGAIRRIVHFLTRRGYINYGSLDNAPVPFPIAGNMKTV